MIEGGQLEATAVLAYDDWRRRPKIRRSKKRWSEATPLSASDKSDRGEILTDLGEVTLMERVARADRSAYAELFRRYAPKIKSFHLGLRATPAQADDLLQDVMVTIWRRAETYDAAKASVSTWIYTVARNRFIDKVRKEKRSEILMETDTERPSEDMAADDAMNLDQQTAALRVALKVLPPEQCEAISMAFLREMSHGEIAAELDLPLGTVKSRIRLAMTRLRDQLESVR